MFKCDICGKEFDSSTKLGGHKSSHFRIGKKYPRNKTIEKDFSDYPKCLNCDKQLYNKRNKYCSSKCQSEYYKRNQIQKWLSGEITGFSNDNHWGDTPKWIRSYLFKIHNYKCARCGWSEINPFTGKLPLEVEHKDGNYKNNRPENLTLLCPNCHSLTEYYRGANRGKGRGKTWIPIE